MNVAAHQEKKESHNMGKREAGEEKKNQAIDRKETECCPSVVVQRAERQKNGCMKEVPGITETLGNANSHLLNPPQMGSGTTPPR